LPGGIPIKNQEILSVISEISETLSLTNEPRQLLETALDSLTEVLVLDCCWIQLISRGNDKLPLIASRGFSPEMYQEVASINLGHRFGHEIVGQGHSIIIPNLSQDGLYDIPIFEQSGFRSLIAVPIMTYRVHGIMGVAYRFRKKFGQDFTQLLLVIAKLIGMSLNKSLLYKKPPEKKKPAEKQLPVPEVISSDAQPEVAKTEKPVETEPSKRSRPKQSGQDFEAHVDKMRVFYKSHRSQR